MHKINIPAYVDERSMQRRGRIKIYDHIDPARTAHIIVDLALEAQQLDLTRQQLAQHLQQTAQRIRLEERLAQLEPHRHVCRDPECLTLDRVGALDD